MKWHWDCCSTTPPASVFSRAEFTYNGDGQRVKSVLTTDLGSTTTYFVGAHYEVTDGVVTKYYYAGSQRIAMRSNGTLYFMLGDHLGSTSLVTFANGNVVSEMRYKAWGEVRYSSAYAQTNYSYTGQYSYTVDFGLIFYNARWYDPYLNQFTQPDSIVPDPYNPLDWNRYSYARYNPLKYTDPSGHAVSCEFGDICKNNHKKRLTLVSFEDYTGSWSSFPEAKDAIEKGAYQLGTKIASTLNQAQRTLEKMGELEDPHHYSPEEAFLKAFDGPVTFTLLANAEDYAGEANSFGGINIYLPKWVATHSGIVIHELFHRLESILGVKNLELPVELRRTQGDYGTAPTYNGFFGGQYVGQFALSHQLQYGYETLADMGLGWATNKWGAGSLGTQRQNYMESLMTDLLVRFIP